MGAQKTGNLKPNMAKSKNFFSSRQPFDNRKTKSYLLSVVYRKLILKKRNIDTNFKILTHAILLPFHIKNQNQLNGHELTEEKNGRINFFFNRRQRLR